MHGDLSTSESHAASTILERLEEYKHWMMDRCLICNYNTGFHRYITPFLLFLLSFGSSADLLSDLMSAADLARFALIKRALC